MIASSRRGGVQATYYVLHIPEVLVLVRGRALLTLCGRTTTRVNCCASLREVDANSDAICRACSAAACSAAYRKITK
jgi:hypothetical protein